MPGNPYQPLLANLQMTQKVYEHLLDLAEKKRRHIVANDVEALRQDIQAEQRLAAEGARLNTEREALHHNCGVALQVKGACGKLEDLCRAMAPEWAARFERERSALRRTLERLLSANRANSVLINNSLDLMQGLLTAMFGGERIYAYGPNGVRAKAEYSLRSLDTNA